MATKFFTNSGDNTLLNKFDGIFKNTSVHYFDALVGYFRSSGYFQIRKYLKDVDQIRILVGIDVDHLISEAARKGLEFNFNTEVTRQEFIREFKEDIQQAEYQKDVEEGIVQFVEDVTSGKILIKAHPDKNIHAKIYIFKPENWNEHNSGSVITGSSNLSVSGLDRNFEFNVELRDYDDVVFAGQTFENLWKEAIDILPSEIETVKKKTYLNDTFTPFELYIKLLIEYFGKSIEYDPESITDLPKGYKKLAYQMDAVNDGYAKLFKHDGFILADVVGLGKTIIATIIAKKYYFSNGYRTKILVIHPPALVKGWTKTVRDFEVPGVEFITNGSLHKIKHPEDYDLIIVDEAHKFRSDESEMFNQLQKLCKTPRKRKGNDGSDKKKVILVTATPLNNKPEDIRNQLYLFQDSKKSTLEVGNLQHFFRPLIDQYRKLKQERDHDKIAKGVKKIYNEIRVKVLESIIVRRTRTDIKNTPEYWEDIVNQGVVFPNINPPRQILYELDNYTDNLYDITLKTLKKESKDLGYYRYQAIKYLRPEAKEAYQKATGVNPSQADRISDQLAHIMRILLVKRIDSSFHAFKMSLGRYYDANRAMLKMIKNGTIYIAPKLNVSDFILNENEAELEEILRNAEDTETINAYPIEDFYEEFIQGIKHDHLTLTKLKVKWDEVTEDPKYNTFVKRINNELMDSVINDNKKLLVFSESKETTNYLFERLKKDGFNNVLCVDSSNSKELTEIISQNFDANEPISEQKDDYDIILTTEVLAEGVNLHRSNIILNYDIPWNATRLMQRIGRVNRIGTESTNIYIYNFFPTSRTDNEIELNKKAYIKLQAFHSALGEDSQIYSTREEFDSFGLFEKVPEEEKDERLEFLNYLRKFRTENPDLYQKIKKTIPKRARTGRHNKSSKNQTITFIKNKKRDVFYLIYPNLQFKELTFVETARIFKAQLSERPIPIHGLHHEQIQIALNSFQNEENLTNLGDLGAVKLGPNDKRAIAFITKQALQEFVSKEDKELIELTKLAIKRGKFQKLPREINKLLKSIKDSGLTRSEVFENLIEILKSYPLDDVSKEIPEIKKSKTRQAVSTPNIILSESFSI
ncbi:helicase-related protein [Christiangramia sp. OXR-203]|uniref:helicase-related protein n=1 Tax=Christiangramia sp. OXR-203 TaxID=3100176 RepID=UPI002AC8D4CC|nr:helicase-related protein [Christiangramia sp. OXR-203]WPY97805.1 helicase-related protein [Christiangramia sp. OXR-203]